MNCFPFDPLNFPSSAVKPKKKRTKLLGLSAPAFKPDPNAPKITEPCKVCGKKFWSEKALYGHMRCHPDRPWRGINPPANFQPPQPETSSSATQEEEEVAACLLILANQGGGRDIIEQDHKCSVCFRVFSSGQALGGHKRCHRETMIVSPSSALNLNRPFPALIDHDHDDYSCALDLRLGL